jgi:hypothetical protein
MHLREEDRKKGGALTRLAGGKLPGVYAAYDQHLPLPHGASDLVLIRDFEDLQALPLFHRLVIREHGLRCQGGIFSEEVVNGASGTLLCGVFGRFGATCAE